MKVANKEARNDKRKLPVMMVSTMKAIDLFQAYYQCFCENIPTVDTSTNNIYMCKLNDVFWFNMLMCTCIFVTFCVSYKISQNYLAKPNVS